MSTGNRYRESALARWAGTSPEERRAATAAASDVRVRGGIDNLLARVERAAPLMTGEQQARLRALADGGPGDEAG